MDAEKQLGGQTEVTSTSLKPSVTGQHRVQDPSKWGDAWGPFQHGRPIRYGRPGSRPRYGSEARDRTEIHDTPIDSGTTTLHMTGNWDDISFVISSQYRIAVLRQLSEGPATPSRIAGRSDCGIAHISRALQELRDRTLVELLVSEDRRKGRVYGVTEDGAQIWEKIEAENMM